MSEHGDDVVNALRALDPLREAEEITGRSYKTDEFTGLLGLAFHMERSMEMKEALESADDTTLSDELDRYLRILQEEGFELAFKVPFCGRHVSDEALYAYWHKDGILLVFDTFTWSLGDKPNVNGGKFYYNWRPTKENWRSALSSGSFGSTEIWAGDHDCREALRLKLRNLRDAGEFICPWVRRPFLWLLHHMDAVGSYDHATINAQRIALLPEHVRVAITPEKICY